MPRYIHDLPRLGEPARIHQVFQTVLECAPGQLLLQGVQNGVKAGTLRVDGYHCLNVL